MKKVIASFLFALVSSLPVLLTACDGGGDTSNNNNGGGGGDSGGGDGGGQTKPPGNPADLVTACKSLCAAYGEAACENWITQDQCELQCANLPLTVDDYCIGESAEYYACAGTIDYECQDGYPVAASQLEAIECLEEQARANLCLQGKPCRDYCDAAGDAGCGGPSLEACAAACEDEQQSVGFCYSEHYTLLACETQNMACQAGEPAPVGCNVEKYALVTCIQGETSTDPCGAYCWLAQDEGCDTGTVEECEASCQAVLTPEPPDAYCSYEMENLRKCEGASLTCQSGEPVVGASCDAEKQSVADCADSYNACSAYCWFKDAKGCGAAGGYDACMTDCGATIEAASYCSYEYEDYLECQIQQDIACTAGSTLCQYQKDSYDMCIANL